MRYHAEHAWWYRKTVEILFVEALVEPVELGYESQVRICTLSSLFYSPVAFIEVDSFRDNHVSNANSRWPWNSLHTVHIDFATLLSCFHHELDSIIEDTLDILSDMVFQVVALIDYTRVFVIVVTEVSCTIDHMRYSYVLERFTIPCNHVATQVQETVDYFRADPFVEFIFVFFPRRPLIVEVFIVELLRRNLEIFKALWTWLVCSAAVSVAFTLSLAAWCSKLLPIRWT